MPVNNFPFDTADEEIRSLFSRVGPVRTFRRARDRETNQPRGYGWVDYGTREDATRAVQEMDGFEIRGRRLRVSLVEPNASGGAPGQFMGQRPPPTNFNNGPRGPQFMPPPPGMQGAFPFPPMGMHPQAMAMQHLAGMGAPMMPPGAVPPGMGAPPPHPGGGGAPANWPAAAPVPPAPIKFSLDKLTREQAFELIKQMKHTPSDQVRVLLEANADLVQHIVTALVSCGLVDAVVLQELYETYNRKLASQQQAVAPQPAPPAAPPVQPESDDQQAALLKMVMELRPEDIESLPAEQRNQILALRQQVMQGRP